MIAGSYSFGTHKLMSLIIAKALKASALSKSHVKLLWDLGNDEEVFTSTFIVISSFVAKCLHVEYIFFLIFFLTSFPDKTNVVSFLWKHTRKYTGRNLDYNFIFQVTDHRWSTLIMRNREKFQCRIVKIQSRHIVYLVN